MRRKVAKIGSALLYMVALVALLFLQKSRMEAMISGIAANMLTLILVLPTIWIFRSWLKKEEKESDISIHKSEDKAARCLFDIEYIRKHFVTYMTKESLSEREIEVAWLIYRGYTNLQIAEELFISETTVKKHATHIYEKLNISSRKELKEINVLEQNEEPY